MTQKLSPDSPKPRDLSLAVYRRIENDLRARVAGGEWAAGVMMPSRKALAAEYGVDLGTLQRAISGLLADGTVRADGGRGTFVANAAAQAVAADTKTQAVSSKLVALIFDQSFNPTDPGAQAIPRAVYHKLRAQESEYRMLTFDTHGETPEQIVSLERHALDAVGNEGIAGVILWHSGGEQTLPQIRRLIEHDVPVIFMDRYPASVDCDFVGVDDEAGAHDAVEYLLSLGHRRIGFLAPLENITTIEQRLSGYQKALAAAGIVPRTEWVCRLPYTLSLNINSLQQQVRQAIETLASLEDPPTAVFAVNDFLAHRLIAAATEIGLSVPEDICVMGFDDTDRFSPRTPFLTTVHQPFELMGERAADLLLQRLRTPVSARRTFQHVLLSTKIVVRSSCRPFGPGDGTH
jgi:DNA-binding LacI/PurR family transcriptional regulator